MKVLIIIAVLFSNLTYSKDTVCTDLFFVKTKLSPEKIEEVTLLKTRLDEVFNYLSKVKLLDSSRKLDYENFYVLDRALVELDEVLKNLSTVYKGQFDNEMALFLETRIKLLEKISNNFSNTYKKTYDINEHEILRGVNQKLKIIENYTTRFGKIFRFKISKQNKRATTLMEATEVYIKDQQKVLKGLFHTTNYKTYKQYQKALDAWESEGSKEAVSMIRNENVEMIMLRPSNGRWWIEKVGFKNQHVTGSSRGFMGHKGRNAVEASLSSKTYKNFAKFDNDLKPKYGMLAPKTDSGISIDMPHYGDDIYIFKKSKVKNSVTFTLGDSLNPIPSNRPETRWTGGETFTPDHWDEVFLPWSQKELMTPVLKKGIQSKKFSLEYSEMDDLGLSKKWSRGGEYLELQFWGDLNLSQVEKFIFTREPPTAEFYRILKERGIKVYDGRKYHLSTDGLVTKKEWKPSDG